MDFGLARWTEHNYAVIARSVSDEAIQPSCCTAGSLRSRSRWRL